MSAFQSLHYDPVLFRSTLPMTLNERVGAKGTCHFLGNVSLEMTGTPWGARSSVGPVAHST